MQEILSVIRGGSDADTLKGAGKVRGYTNNETFYGGEGNDTIYGGGGNDVLYGEEDDDVLYGEDGDDVLVGGAGDDYLNGGYGADTYIYNLGDGNDTIRNNRRSGETDTLMIGTDISGLTFSRTGNHLLITVGGEEGSISVENWYLGSGYQLDSIQTSDGYALAGEQVDLLIQAMASFESTNGMEWQDALRLQDERAVSLAEQYWVKQVG
ncbi:MAG: hypothetical protein K2O32_00045 [Acetatifactor sp.]|nr:hypothetical protein [Acetatifactor sp.]